MAPFPHESIRESEDRSWSLRLLDEIIHGSNGADLSDVAKTLAILDDPRTVLPLTNVMENTNKDAQIRAVASDILNKCTTWESVQDRQSWWSSGDEILMRHAVRMAERSETKLIEEIASDPENRLYIDAIAKLTHGFEEPRFQQLKINALSHSQADVRATAARALLWDQPVAAEDSLLMVAQDEDDLAGEEALDALAYYGSQKVLLALHDMSISESCCRRPESATVAAHICRDFVREYERLLMHDPAAVPFFVTWLEPVWRILSIEPANSIAESSDVKLVRPPLEASFKSTPSITKLKQRFSNPNGAWRDRWALVKSVDWASYSSKERSEFARYCCTHQDWTVREVFCSVLAQWHATDTLLGFVDDPIFAVRKMATYYLIEVPRFRNPFLRTRLAFTFVRRWRR